MVRRRSLRRKKSLKRQLKKGRRSRKRHFGKEDEKNDKVSKKNLFSSIFKDKQIQAFQVFVQRLVPNVLKNLKPGDEIKEEHLSCGQKIKRYFERIFIKWFKPSIDKVITTLNPSQIILLLKGAYNKQLSNSILWGSKLEEVNTSQISGLDSLKLMILQSELGTSIIKNIKKFIESLSPEQMVKLINGDFNLNNALLNGFLGTKFPTKKEIKDAKAEIADV
jgi:hypothetical protein